jgi:hypothetical protein
MKHWLNGNDEITQQYSQNMPQCHVIHQNPTPTWEWTRTSAVTSWRLTASAMARSYHTFKQVCPDLIFHTLKVSVFIHYFAQAFKTDNADVRLFLELASTTQTWYSGRANTAVAFWFKAQNQLGNHAYPVLELHYCYWQVTSQYVDAKFATLFNKNIKFTEDGRHTVAEQSFLFHIRFTGMRIRPKMGAMQMYSSSLTISRV